MASSCKQAVDKQVVQLHVVAVPYPAQGHINPMLQLCQQLVPLGFTFTFVNTHHIHQRLMQASAATPTQHNLADIAGRDPVPAAQDQDADQYVHDSKHAANGSNADAMNNIATAEADAHANGVAPHADGGHVVQILSQHALKECDPIRMVFVEGGCPPERFAQRSTSRAAFAEAQAMKDQVEQLISNVMEEQPVAFILTDVLLVWANSTASKFGLPWVCFWPASASTFATLVHLADVAEQGKLIPVAGNQDGEVPVIDSIPGVPPTSLNEIFKVWDDTGKLLYHEFLKYFSAVEHASFLLLNTFSELEGQAVAALCKRCPTLTVGPLLPSRFINSEGADAHITCPVETKLLSRSGQLVRPSLFREDRTCLDWLDKQAPSSVLFISFGSISARTKEQLEELAQGVEASGCPSLWVRKPDIAADPGPTDSGRRPHAVQHAGNGLIVPWAPQLEVLSHASVGGFITHCGWNSVMESVAMGVPMLCWADNGERMSNQRFVVQFWKCGMDMVADSSKRYKQHIDEAVLVRRAEIEEAIRCLMKAEEGGAPIRARAAQLREIAISAFRDSSRSFDHFVQAMQRT